MFAGMKTIIAAFGFEWKLAPGEAEAELAYLNAVGVIDGVLSDDVDNFLFGAKTVIRNPSNNLSGNKSNKALNSEGRDDGNHVRVFKSVDLDLSQEDMILIGLCSGGDYHTGIDGCGIKIAVGLAKAGFAKRLVEARRKHPDDDAMKDFLCGWREDVREELKTNSSGCLGRRSPALAKKVLESFPGLRVLDSYMVPVTSRSMGRDVEEYYQPDKMWAKEPNLEVISRLCEKSFEWGYLDIIIKRFRTLLWPGVIVRVLRRACLERDAASSSSTATAPITPRKRPGNLTTPSCETPSKILARHFNALTVAEDSDEDDPDALFIDISRTREHPSTDGMLEYRVTVNPASLVRMATQGVIGDRAPRETPDWELDEDDEDGETKTKGKAPPDPLENVKLWLPECMFRIAEPGITKTWESGVRKKADKKAEAEKKRVERERKKAEKALGLGPPQKTKSTGKSKVTTTKAATVAAHALDPGSDMLWNPEEDEESDGLPAPAKSTQRSKSVQGRGKTAKSTSTSSEKKLDSTANTLWNPEESDVEVAPRASSSKARAARLVWEDSDGDDLAAPLPTTRIIRDLSEASSSQVGASKPIAVHDDFCSLPPLRPIRDLSRKTTGSSSKVSSTVTPREVEESDSDVSPRTLSTTKKTRKMKPKPVWHDIDDDFTDLPPSRPIRDLSRKNTASSSKASSKAASASAGLDLRTNTKITTKSPTRKQQQQQMWPDSSDDEGEFCMMVQVIGTQIFRQHLK